MCVEFKKEYDPELDVCNLLHFYFCSTPPKPPVAASLEQLSAERGIPLEALRDIAAPALELESYILGNLRTPEERLRYYFPPAEQQDGAVGLPFCWFYKQDIRFRDLPAQERAVRRNWLLRNISNVGVDELSQAEDLSALFQILQRHHCTDHTIRICMEIYLDPVRYEEEFAGIVEEAAALYREKMYLLPPAEECTFHTFFKKWQEDGDNLRTLISSFPHGVQAACYSTPFLFFCREAVLIYLPDDASCLNVLSGIWDDRIAELIDQSSFSVATLAMELKAISDKRRLEIMGAIGEGVQSVEALCNRFSMSPALLSYHLDQLYRVNLITLKRSGRNNLYSLNHQYLQILMYHLERHLHLPTGRPEHSPQEGVFSEK